MHTKQEIIIRHHREGKSQRQIARDLQISRRTVKKYIEEFESRLNHCEDTITAQADYLSSPPVYNSKSRGKLRLTQEVQAEIDRMQGENQQKREKGLRKQLLKKCDILEALQEKGYRIGYTTVCNYIRKKEEQSRHREAFIRQEYQPGASCEFDWGEIKLTLSGHVYTVCILPFLQCLPGQREETCRAECGVYPSQSLWAPRPFSGS